MKSLGVEDGLVEQLSRCLRSEGRELPLWLLPELQELTCYGSGDAGVHLIHRRPSEMGASISVTTGTPLPGRYHVANGKFVVRTTVTDKKTKLISADNPGTF